MPDNRVSLLDMRNFLLDVVTTYKRLKLSDCRLYKGAILYLSYVLVNDYLYMYGRRTLCNTILQRIKDEGAFSTMHTLLVYLQMAPMEQQPIIATLLLQLDLLVCNFSAEAPVWNETRASLLILPTLVVFFI